MAGAVEIIGLDELLSNLALLERTMTGDELAEVAMVGAVELRDWVRDSCERSLHMWTWALWKSIQAGVEHVAKTTVRCRVYSDLIYAGVHEFGMTIYPRTKKFLSWIDWATGKRIFAKRVTIPARPYFRPGIAKGRPHAVKAMLNHLALRISGLPFKGR